MNFIMDDYKVMHSGNNNKRLGTKDAWETYSEIQEERDLEVMISNDLKATKQSIAAAQKSKPSVRIKVNFNIKLCLCLSLSHNAYGVKIYYTWIRRFPCRQMVRATCLVPLLEVMLGVAV